MLSAVPSYTHDLNGQVNKRMLNRLLDRGAKGSMSNGLRTDDGERRNTELETLEEGEHSTTKTETMEAEWKTPMEETQIDTIVSAGPNNVIAGADMCIISNRNPETQDRHSDGDNNDNQLNGGGVTNGYAFDSNTDRLTRTPD